MPDNLKVLIWGTALEGPCLVRIIGATNTTSR